MGIHLDLMRIAGRWRRSNGELPSDREVIRRRDGDHCWLCGGAIQFEARPNSNAAPSIEHLVPLSRGGSSALSNKVLCHVSCNRDLRNHPLEQKELMRAVRQQKRRKRWRGR
ncbi:HNH endonuclease [Sphingomicrobium nitratireducens]|uniref:HNH endonuclease n=1 Tax=Sphingomicrobium nitratireducens TaxID=2964666 RepID=UPI00223ED57C|nr:HNH endonuclease domain-containing protein [Sphingomicrobium nitratireducens]